MQAYYQSLTSTPKEWPAPQKPEVVLLSEDGDTLKLELTISRAKYLELAQHFDNQPGSLKEKEENKQDVIATLEKVVEMAAEIDPIKFAFCQNLAQIALHNLSRDQEDGELDTVPTAYVKCLFELLDAPFDEGEGFSLCRLIFKEVKGELKRMKQSEKAGKGDVERMYAHKYGYVWIRVDGDE